MASHSKEQQRRKRHRHVRKKIIGTAERPRLNVFRSNRHIAAQIVDDTAGRTLLAASTLTKELRQEGQSGADQAAARKVGQLVAKRAKEKGIEKVVFDRAGYQYHGRVKALAEGAREGGLKF